MNNHDLPLGPSGLGIDLLRLPVEIRDRIFRHALGPRGHPLDLGLPEEPAIAMVYPSLWPEMLRILLQERGLKIMARPVAPGFRLRFAVGVRALLARGVSYNLPVICAIEVSILPALNVATPLPVRLRVAVARSGLKLCHAGPCILCRSGDFGAHTNSIETDSAVIPIAVQQAVERAKINHDYTLGWWNSTEWTGTDRQARGLSINRLMDLARSLGVRHGKTLLRALNHLPNYREAEERMEMRSEFGRIGRALASGIVTNDLDRDSMVNTIQNLYWQDLTNDTILSLLTFNPTLPESEDGQTTAGDVQHG